MITPFLVVPVAAALLFKHAIFNPSYGLHQWAADHHVR
jgi:sorbitol/mannitol transport system permease protein